MLIYGGVYGEDNRVLDDMVMFDMQSRSWAKIKQLKANTTVIGALAYHSMTSAFEKGLSLPVLDSKLLWIKTP